MLLKLLEVSCASITGGRYSLYYPNFGCQNLSDVACGMSCDVLAKHPRYPNQMAYPGAAWCRLVSEHPDIPIEVSISRMGALSHQIGACGSNGQGNQSLPSTCYLQNDQGQ